MPNRLIWLDFETMGVDPTQCAVIDMSIAWADVSVMLSDKPYTCRYVSNIKKFKISIEDQVKKYKYVVEPETLTFWQEQSSEARKAIKPSSADLKLEEFCWSLIETMNDIGKADYWFTRGNNFDPLILQRIFKSVGKSHIFNEYFTFYKVQDMRTFINAKLDYPHTTNMCPIKDEDFWNKIFVQHDSRWDVLADLMRYQTIIRLENDLDQPQR